MDFKNISLPQRLGYRHHRNGWEITTAAPGRTVEGRMAEGKVPLALTVVCRTEEERKAAMTEGKRPAPPTVVCRTKEERKAARAAGKVPAPPDAPKVVCRTEDARTAARAEGKQPVDPGPAERR